MKPSVRLRSSPRALFVERMDVAAGDLHDAGGRPVETAENLQQRGLAGAGRADDGDAFAGAHREVHALQHLEVDGPLAKRARDARGFEHDVRSWLHSVMS